MINNKVRHNLVNAKCRWPSNRLDGAGSFREPLGQMKVIQIRQRETKIHQRETTHEICCLAAQCGSEKLRKTNSVQWSQLLRWPS